MNRLDSIVVGVDFSECSRCAFEQAARMARWNHSSLLVLHALDPGSVNETAQALNVPTSQIEDELRRHARQRLSEWVDLLAPGQSLKLDVVSGPPIDVFLSAVRSVGADLLVLGVTGDSLQSMGAGTLATKCLRKTACKVLLVKQGHSYPIRKIVACVDFSDTSQQAVVQALRVASQDKAEVHFLHVYQPRWRQWLAAPEPLPACGEFEKNYRALLETNLRNFVNSNAGSLSVFTVLESSTLGHGIAEYCQRVQADLVILGSKGKTNLQYVLLGSTVERLLKEVPCSALLVRPLTTTASTARAML